MAESHRREGGRGKGKVSGGSSLREGQPLQGTEQEELWPKSPFTMAA